MKAILPFHFSKFPTVFSCAVLLASTSLAPAVVTLKGIVGPRIIHDDVLIARDTSCVLDSTVIQGNVQVDRGAKLVAVRAQISGNITAATAAAVDLRIFTTVTGTVRGDGARLLAVQSGTRIEGNVRLADSPAPSGLDALLVVNSTVLGSVRAERNSGLVRVAGSRITGDVKFVENRRGSYLIRANVIGGSIRFLDNRGPGVIALNRVAGDLVSSGNIPLPKIANNIVTGDSVIK